MDHYSSIPQTVVRARLSLSISWISFFWNSFPPWRTPAGLYEYSVTAAGMNCFSSQKPSARRYSMFCLPAPANVSPVLHFPSTQALVRACMLAETRGLVGCFDVFLLVWFDMPGSLAVNCAGLTRLNLSGCLGICGPGLAAVGECCPKLMHLDLSDCKQVSNAKVKTRRVRLYRENILAEVHFVFFSRT